MDECDGYIRHQVAPWTNKQLQEPPPASHKDAQLHLTQAKVTARDLLWQTIIILTYPFFLLQDKNSL